MSSQPDKSPSAAGSAGSQPTPSESVAEGSTDERRYSGLEVAGIIRDRLARADKANADKLSAVAEQAALAAAARVRADLDAEVAELAELAGVTPKDLLDARRLQRRMARGRPRSDLSMRVWKKG